MCAWMCMRVHACACMRTLLPWLGSTSAQEAQRHMWRQGYTAMTLGSVRQMTHSTASASNAMPPSSPPAAPSPADAEASSVRLRSIPYMSYFRCVGCDMGCGGTWCDV